MPKNRLEAFSDGVLAIIITVLLLNMYIPQSPDIAALKAVVPVFFSYVLSFLYVAIYWNNHHHLLNTVTHVTGKIMWANMNLLFWLSLLPFVTGWMGQNHFAPMPTCLYGIILLLSASAYFILQDTIIISQGKHSLLKRAIGKDWKSWASLALYFLGIVLSLVEHWSATACYFLVALIWIVPDPRIERALDN